MALLGQVDRQAPQPVQAPASTWMAPTGRTDRSIRRARGSQMSVHSWQAMPAAFRQLPVISTVTGQGAGRSRSNTGFRAGFGAGSAEGAFAAAQIDPRSVAAVELNDVLRTGFPRRHCSWCNAPAPGPHPTRAGGIPDPGGTTLPVRKARREGAVLACAGIGLGSYPVGGPRKICEIQMMRPYPPYDSPLPEPAPGSQRGTKRYSALRLWLAVRT